MFGEREEQWASETLMGTGFHREIEGERERIIAARERESRFAGSRLFRERVSFAFTSTVALTVSI